MAIVRRIAAVSTLVGLLTVGLVAPAAASSPPVISEVSTPAPVMSAGGDVVISWRVESTAGIGTYPDVDGPRVATWIKLAGVNGWATWCGFPVAAQRVSGDDVSGTYAATCRIPADTPNGGYTAYIEALDRAGSYAEQQSVWFNVIGGSGDFSVPVVGNVSVDRLAGPGQDVTIAWDATDESGVAYLVPWVAGPNGRFVDDAGIPWAGFVTGSRVAGTDRDGRWSATLPLAVGAEPGTYTVYFSVGDVVGNRGFSASSVTFSVASGPVGDVASSDPTASDSRASVGAPDEGTESAAAEGTISRSDGGSDPAVGAGAGAGEGVSVLGDLISATRLDQPSGIAVALVLVGGLVLIVGFGWRRGRRRPTV